MKRLPLVAFFIVLFFGYANSEKGIELDLGFLSRNKGLLGARFLPSENWSVGVLWGLTGRVVPFDLDLGIAYSYHFLGWSGPYIYQSHHWLHFNEGTTRIIFDEQGHLIKKEYPTKNAWELNTGLGYQYLWNNGILVFAELGVPIYAANGSYYRYYEPGGFFDNNNDVLFTIKFGFGIGYIFKL